MHEQISTDIYSKEKVINKKKLILCTLTNILRTAIEHDILTINHSL